MHIDNNKGFVDEREDSEGICTATMFSMEAHIEEF